MRIGVEIEYWTVDREGDLVPAEGLVSACEGLDREFVEPLVEVKTPPCESVAALSECLATRLDRAIEAARERGKRLVPLGTPLGDETIPIRSSDRIEVQRAVLGDDFRHAAHCAGAHLHVEQAAPVDQLRLLTALDPAFALVDTTPYYRGRRIAACARPLVYRRRCYESLPTHGRLWRYPESVAEWRERRERRFETFREAAIEAGVERGVVESAFSPEDALWSPVRLRDDLGTVEWRSPDAGPPVQLLRLLEDAVGILERGIERGVQVGDADRESAVVVPPFETLLDRVDAAIEFGRGDRAVERHLERLGFETEAYRPAGTRIDGRERLDHGVVRRLRLRAADRLEREVERLLERDPDAAGRAISASR